MPLTLITGPANAEKAREALGALRAFAAAGSAPLLIVPTIEDVREYRSELAGDDVLLGVRVERFAGLMAEVADRAGVLPRPASRIVREQVARAAAALCDLGPTARSAATDGFAGALVDLAAELAGHGVGTGRFVAAMRAWGQADPARAAYARDLELLICAYRDRLERLGRPEPADSGRAALDVLRGEPRRWGATPVVLYGFDDFAPAQLDAIETLAVHAGAPVTVALPFEAGRAVFAARAQVHAELAELAAERVVLPASDAPYAAAARAPLHGLERGLLASGAPTADPVDAVVLLEGGDPRAELELVAEHVRGLIAAGTPAEAIVIAARDVTAAAALLETVLSEADVPFALRRTVPLAHTALGAGVLGLLRAALPGGTAEDLVQVLRTPGYVKRPALVDEAERRIRTHGVTTATRARETWDRLEAFPLAMLDRVAAAAGRGVPALCRCLAAEAARLLAAPQRPQGSDHGLARDLTGDEAHDAAALRTLVPALGDIGRLAEHAPALAPDAAGLARTLAVLAVEVGTPAGPGHVTVTSPLAIRGRRVDVLILCRMQADTFPRAGVPEPFLGDDERRALNAASGLRLAPRETSPAVEQHLLYAAVSRPTCQLVLASHTGDDDGEAVVRSLFVDDVLACMDPAPPTRTRLLGALGWDPAAAVSPRQRALGERARGGAAVPAGGPARGAIGPLTNPVVLAALAERDAWSATEIEAWAGCPVDWFAERHLRPGSLDPDAIPMARGAAAHAALEWTLQELGEPLTAASLAAAERLLPDALTRALAERPIAVERHREVAERHRVEADLLRYLAHAARAGSAFRPAHFELAFGTRDALFGVVELEGGLRLRGKIDRVDLSADGTQAIIIDYKGRRPRPGWAGWIEDGSLQAGLYALALGVLLPGTEVVGALLQPIGAEDHELGARGFLVEGADGGRTDTHADDRLTAGERDVLLGEIRTRAIEITGRIRAGDVQPSPATCGYRRDGCAHPTICRCAA